MHMLPHSREAAVRVKQVLQGVFEGTYSFDLDHLKKETLGTAIKKLTKYGASPFGLAHLTQTALAVTDLIVDVRSGERRLLGVTAVASVQAAFDPPLAIA